MRYVWYYINSVLTVTLCAMPVAAIWRILRIRLLRRSGIRTTALHEFGMILLAAYLVAFASQTIVPRVWHLPSLSMINLIPFHVFYDTYIECTVHNNILPLLLNFAGNILIIIPLGFLTELLFRRPCARKAALSGLCVSLIAELGQLFSERCTDIDDLWLNTLGALAGYGIYVLFARLFPSSVAAFRVTPPASETEHEACHVDRTDSLQ